MSKALYRKYRPSSLDQVIGQNQVTDALANTLDKGNISHAYLFVGPRGTGKTSVARIFAHAVNQFDYQLEDDYVDIIEIDGASNRGIDDIRELREKAAIAPTEGKFKVYIIDEVHMLTREAFNALLKTLEEPPAHVIFIMATTEIHKVPATILSRAQTYNFDTMFNFLQKIAKDEDIKITDEALEIITERGGGSFRDSVSLLDQISSLSDQEITADLVISAMGLPIEREIKNLLTTYTSGNLEQISGSLKHLLTSGIKPEIITENLIKQIVAQPTPETLNLLSRLTEVSAPFPEAKLLVALTKDLQTTPKISPQNTPAPAPTTKARPTTSNQDFNWSEFISKIKPLSSTVHAQLQKVTHEIIGNTLHLYPKSKGGKMILSSPNNQKILTDLAKGLKVLIHNISDRPTTSQSTSKSNPKTDQLSDIMGGEVTEYGGENPFESE